MTAVQILIGVASVLDRDAASALQQRFGNYEATARHFANQAKRVRAAIDLIKNGEYREFEFKGVLWTRLPSGKIVRGA